MGGRVQTGLQRIGMVMSIGVSLYAFAYLTPWGAKIPQILANVFARPWLGLHVAGGGVALLIAPFNLLAGLRRRRPGAHRIAGRTYVCASLIGGASGVMLALGSTAGPIATAGFGSLGVVWLLTTYMGYAAARARRFDAHRRWMLRSFALTFAAVTLRLDLAALIVSRAPFVAGYQLISFLCWVPNLLLSEAYIRGARPGLTSRPAVSQPRAV